MTTRPIRRRTLIAAGIGALALRAQAQSFPARPIRLLVGYAAGGPVDNAVRRIIPALQKELGQSVVVDNRGGAGGTLAADLVAKAEPDGYTLIFMASPTQVMTPHMMKTVPFDPVRDFTPISMAVGFATLLVVNKDLPVQSVDQLVAYAKANPNKVSFGSAGIGSSNHLAGELLKKETGAPLLHVPYKGNALAMTDVIGGQISFMFNSVGDSLPYVSGGKVRAIAVSSIQRSRALPTVPTVAESGLPNFDVTAWYALEGPPRMPPDIVARLNTAMRNVLTDAAVAKQFSDIGYDVMPSTPDELGRTIRSDYERWGPVARSINLN
jgi:tripartite-type tricarboxylate transporter receptor subunit TctC